MTLLCPSGVSRREPRVERPAWSAPRGAPRVIISYEGSTRGRLQQTPLKLKWVG